VILGPILVGWAAVRVDDPRQSLMVLLLLFVPGALLLWRVPEPSAVR
jgi:MFS-type transporter involved in bile tolerance (Atg22 family)